MLQVGANGIEEEEAVYYTEPTLLYLKTSKLYKCE
jgi:hypothetical protein